MLYETLSQPTILYIFLLAGIASGFVIGAGKVINLIFGDNFVVRYLIDILCVAFCFCLFFYFNVKYNFGQMRLYVMLIFGVGIIAQRYSVGFFVAKILKKVYNNISPSSMGKEGQDEYREGKSYNSVNNNSRNNIANSNASRTNFSVRNTWKVKKRRKNIK